MKLKVFYVVVFALLTMSIVTNVFAQKTEPSPKLEQALDDDSGSTDKELIDSKEQKKISNTKIVVEPENKQPPKMFKPTEEISEDRPVPFPVDI